MEDLLKHVGIAKDQAKQIADALARDGVGFKTLDDLKQASDHDLQDAGVGVVIQRRKIMAYFTGKPSFHHHFPIISPSFHHHFTHHFTIVSPITSPSFHPSLHHHFTIISPITSPSLPHLLQLPLKSPPA